MICFSPLVADVEAKHKMGYVSCLIFIFNIMINLSIILIQSFRDKIVWLKSWWSKRHLKNNLLKIPVTKLEKEDKQSHLAKINRFENREIS
jgi:hypothetical protein